VGVSGAIDECGTRTHLDVRALPVIAKRPEYRAERRSGQARHLPILPTTMFTGLIQRVGRVADRSPQGTNTTVRLTIHIDPPILANDSSQQEPNHPNTPTRWPGLPRVEESVAIDGCCLTVAEIMGESTLAFDVIPQTLAVTTLGTLRVGDPVNLEQCVSPTGLLGGHIVQGHIDGVGEVLHIQKTEDWRVRVGLPSHLIRYAVPKGSITLAGVSLTLANLDIQAGWIEVALIPTTLERTTLVGLHVGQPINIEMDSIAKTVVHYLENFTTQQPSTTESKLKSPTGAGQ